MRRLWRWLLCLPLLALVPPGITYYPSTDKQYFVGSTPSSIRFYPSLSSAGSSLLTSLVAYWKLDEVSGTRALAAGSCVSCDLTAVNAPTAAGGAGNYALAVVGASNQGLSITSSANFSVSDSSTYMWCVWTYQATASDGTFIAQDDVAANRQFQFVRYLGNAALFIGAGATAPGKALAAGRHLSCGWYDGTNQYAQVDAGTEASAARVGTHGTYSATTIGKLGNNTFNFTGTIGPVMFWKTSMPDATARTALYNSGKGYTCSSLPASLKTGLVYCADLTEASGTRAASSVGSCGSPTCDASAVNAPGRTAGLVQNGMGMSAYSVSGSSMALNLNDNADISVGDTTFTAACWVNSSVLGDKIILDKTNEYRLGIDATNKPYAKTGTTDTATGSATTAGTWILVAGGHKAGTDTWLSVNGGAKVRTPQTAAPSDTANALRIFSTSAGGSYWDGAVDACGLWGAELSEAQLTAWYNTGSGVEYPWSSVAWFLGRPVEPSVKERQFMAWLKTGEVVPDYMFPSRKVVVVR